MRKISKVKSLISSWQTRAVLLAFTVLYEIKSIPVFANTDDLINNGSTVSSSGVADSLPSSGVTSDQANQYLDSVRSGFTDASSNDALSQIQQGVDTARTESFGDAYSLMQPVIWFVAMATNAVWILTFTLFGFSTAVDVFAIVLPTQKWIRKASEYNQARNRPMGLIGTALSMIFTVSLDAEQLIESVGGMGDGSLAQGQGSYGQGNGVQMNYSEQTYGGFNNGFNNGGMTHQTQMQATRGGNPNQQNGHGAQYSRSSVLGAYCLLRMKTFIFLGITFAIFATSLATNIQGGLVGVAIAIIKGLVQLVVNLWNMFATG